MSNPNLWAYSTTSGVTWLPWPSRTNKCQLVINTPHGTNYLKKDKNSLNKKKSSMLSFA
jgi:hypothetical protein